MAALKVGRVDFLRRRVLVAESVTQWQLAALVALGRPPTVSEPALPP
jgi:hypothetical protein